MRIAYSVASVLIGAVPVLAQSSTTVNPPASNSVSQIKAFIEGHYGGGPVPLPPEEAARRTALQKEQIALIRAARQLIGDSDFAGALEQYKKLEALTPEAGLPRVFIGNMLFRLGKYDDAIAAYNMALERGKRLPAFVAPQAYSGLGELYAATGRTEEAIAAYRQIVYRVSGHNWVENGQSVKDKILKSKDDWMTGQGNDPQVLMRYALVLSQSGRYDEAVQVYQWGVKNITHPDHDLLLQTFSAQALDRRRFEAAAHTALGLTVPRILVTYEDAAIAEYRLALAGDRFFAPAYYFLGNSLRAKGSENEARAAFQKAAEVGRGETRSRAQNAIDRR